MSDHNNVRPHQCQTTTMSDQTMSDHNNVRPNNVRPNNVRPQQCQTTTMSDHNNVRCQALVKDCLYNKLYEDQTFFLTPKTFLPAVLVAYFEKKGIERDK